MATLKKKVLFYRFMMEYVTVEDGKSGANVIRTPLSDEDTKKMFNELYNEITDIKSGRKVKKTKTSSLEAVVEVISYKDETVFFKIGQENAKKQLFYRIVNHRSLKMNP